MPAHVFNLRRGSSPLVFGIALGIALAAGCAQGSRRAERSWRVIAAEVPEGVIMAGALLADQTPLLVGGQAEAGAAWRLDAAALASEAVPPGKLLSWASRAEDGSLLVVGLGRRALWRSPDGSWSSEALPDGDELWGCLAFSADDAWAVGGDPKPNGTADPVVLRRQATGWAKVGLPTLSRPGARLFKVDGHGSGEAVAVGDQGLALHWDGAAWSEEASGTGANLTTVRALPDGQYAAVGGVGSGVVLLRAKDGTWHKLRDAESSLSGVDSFDGAIWACGAGGWLEWDTLDGRSASPLRPSPTIDSLHWVLRLPGGDALAGGGNLQVWPGKMHGTLLRWAL
jgi:hypothetical protein